MKISHRLYLTAFPSMLAVCLVVVLWYWAEQGQVAPPAALLAAGAAVLGSLVLAWSNVQYVARRIERLAGAPASGAVLTPSLRAVANVVAPSQTVGEPDELDEIERVVDRLSSAVELAETSRADRERLVERRVRDYARLLSSLVESSTQRLEEIRLPLHILLENHFGDLNENQEEMLGAARAASEAVDAAMLSLAQIAALDLGERSLRRDRIKPSDLIDALRPLLTSVAEQSGVTVQFELAPLLPAVTGDRVMLQEALATLLRDAVTGASPDTNLRIDAEREGAVVRFVIHGAGATSTSVRWAAAVRVIGAHAGTVGRREEALVIDLPIAGVP